MDMIKTVLNTPRLREGAIGALGIALGALLCAAIVHAPGASSDWAAWVQAIGSIAAIIGAFAIANQQAIDARKQTHEAMASRTRHLRLVLREIFAATMEQIENIRGMCSMEPERFALSNRHPVHTLPELSASLLTIPLIELELADSAKEIAILLSAMKTIDVELTRFRTCSANVGFRSRNGKHLRPRNRSKSDLRFRNRSDIELKDAHQWCIDRIRASHDLAQSAQARMNALLDRAAAAQPGGAGRETKVPDDLGPTEFR
ncbi:hypothetical protein [Paraburkholderia sp. 32]|uniref:hypothetical protein n=1 Tax=Paraburkholderia sp. 32 TaxID=2991057 RepID=UPI003D24AF64